MFSMTLIPDEPRNDQAALATEQHQLRLVHWGFRLLGVSLVLQGVLLALSVFQAGDEAKAPANPTLEDYIVTTAFLLVPFLPGTILLLGQARSVRWRRSAWALLLAVMADGTTQWLLFLFHSPGGRMDWVQSPPVLVLEAANHLLGWVELWFTTVLVGEFALAGQANWLLDRCEFLGYVILAGAGASLALLAWTIPSPSRLLDPDPLTQILGLIQVSALVGSLVWLIALVSSASRLALLLSLRCVMARAGEPPVS